MIDTLLPEAAIAPVTLSCLSVIALVTSDLHSFRTGRYIFKPLAAIAFIWLALNLGATSSTYGLWLLSALVACMVGDILLMPETQGTFLAGLSAFLCGHLLFALAFLQLPVNYLGIVISLVPALCILAFALYWLLPHVEGAMRIPVGLYILVITGMLLCAGSSAGQLPATLIIAGAWGFALSDLAVARQQFVSASRTNGTWGTPLYFLSQMLLAGSVYHA